MLKVIAFLCFVSFLFRILAQIFVALYSPSWLPSMSEWYSHLLPYYVLLPIQFLILILMTMVLYDFFREEGIFYIEQYKISIFLMVISLVYATIMIVRLIINSLNIVNNHFINTKIPAYFHLILALFIFIISRYCQIRRDHKPR